MKFSISVGVSFKKSQTRKQTNFRQLALTLLRNAWFESQLRSPNWKAIFFLKTNDLKRPKAFKSMAWTIGGLPRIYATDMGWSKPFKVLKGVWIWAWVFNLIEKNFPCHISDFFPLLTFKSIFNQSESCVKGCKTSTNIKISTQARLQRSKSKKEISKNHFTNENFSQIANDGIQIPIFNVSNAKCKHSKTHVTTEKVNNQVRGEKRATC